MTDGALTRSLHQNWTTMRVLRRTALILLSTLVGSSAQTDGSCICAPSSFVFKLDLSLNCTTNSWTEKPGFERAACLISGLFDNEITDRVPVTVTQITIIELDQGGGIKTTMVLNGEFKTGDTFTYTSLIADDASSETSVPGGFQVTAVGYTDSGEELLMLWILRYTNECDIYPIFSPGESFGWTVLTGVTPPPFSLCPAVDTSPPITPETAAPVIPETAAPINPETAAPIIPETAAPVIPETAAPVIPETAAPIIPVTAAPIEPETPAPLNTVAPVTGMPVTSPIISPVRPTASPVSPVLPPTETPIVTTPFPSVIETFEPTQIQSMSMITTIFPSSSFISLMPFPMESMSMNLGFSIKTTSFAEFGGRRGGKFKMISPTSKHKDVTKVEKAPKATKIEDDDTVKVVKASKKNALKSVKTSKTKNLSPSEEKKTKKPKGKKTIKSSSHKERKEKK